MIVVGTLPIIVVGVLFRHQIKSALRSLYIMSASLAGVALLLALAEWYISRRSAGGAVGRDVEQVGPREALVVGCAQAAALVPGTSRSGATILGGLLCGLTREAAARFSFLLSIPSVFAAGVFELIEAREELMKSTLGPAKLAGSVVVAGIVGYVTIPWLLGYLRRHTMFVFIVYRLLIAGVLFYLLHTGRVAAVPVTGH
jgi:undecaprenyl-diphosphatase